MDGSGCDRGAGRQTETDQEKQKKRGERLEMIQRGVVGWVGAGLVARQNFEGCRLSISLLVDNHIVYLTEHVAGRNQYINAVFMPVSACT